jgi:DNA-binding response OmpR family regulator
MSIVMVVEDEPILLENMAKLLELSGFDVLKASDGINAWNQIQNGLLTGRSMPDLVLSDLMMPNLDGLGLLKLLRAEPTMSRLPFVVLSARSDTQDMKTAFAAGATDYLVKPFDWNQLLHKLGTHLQKTQRSLFPEFEEFSHPARAAHPASSSC